MGETETKPMDESIPAPKHDPLEGLTVGHIVHFVMPDGQHRPAIITNVWDTNHYNGCSNLTVFTDWTNDSGYTEPVRQKIKEAGLDPAQIAKGMVWVTSRLFDEKEKLPGTWHWIEKA